MAKTMTTRLLIVIAAMVAIALSLNSGGREVEAGLPTETPTAVPTATSTPVAETATATPAAGTATATPAAGTATATPAAGTATATPRLPAAAPQTGAEPGSGSDSLTLILLIGAVAIMGAGGVFAGFALGRRIS